MEKTCAIFILMSFAAGHTQSDLTCPMKTYGDPDPSSLPMVYPAFCLPANYSIHDRPMKDGCDDVIKVTTGFVIDDVSDIDDNACEITLVMVMKFRWTEERLVINKTSFEQKLKKGEKFLEVRYLDRETTQLWTPDLYISNMKSLKNTGFVDHPGIKIDVDINKTVYYSRYAEVTFLCPMQFDAFPFDVHNCFFRVQSLETPESALIFRYDPNAPGVIWKTQTILEHSVRFKKLEEVVTFESLGGWSDTYSAIGVEISFRRKYLPFIIDYYLPSGLFVIVSWVSFLVPPAIVPGRMALLVTLFLMLVNISTSATAHSPKSDQINALQVWLLTCIMFVFLALLEYAVILYLKNMKGTHKEVLTRSADVVAITKLPPSMAEASAWTNQQTERLERRIKMLDFACITVFPFIFMAFNLLYWMLQYSYNFQRDKDGTESGYVGIH